MDGMMESKTRKGEREIISVSLPLPLYSDLVALCKAQSLNRSGFIASAIEEGLRKYRLTHAGGYTNGEDNL